MELIFELIMWFITEFVFWGIMFWTGYAITSILTFGKWKPNYVKGDREKQRKTSKFIITALIGFLFWLGIGITVTISMLKS